MRKHAGTAIGLERFEGRRSLVNGILGCHPGDKKTRIVKENTSQILQKRANSRADA
jgi:hypothetical protein